MFMKTAGGVTRGHGISLSNTATWVPSKTATPGLIDAIETSPPIPSCVTASSSIRLDIYVRKTNSRGREG